MKRPTHTAFKSHALSKKEVKAAYDELEPEYALINELIHARKKAHKSQAEVAKAMQTTTSAVSRLESGGGQQRHSPSLDTLLRYAHALGCKLHIRLVPLKRHG